MQMLYILGNYERGFLMSTISNEDDEKQAFAMLSLQFPAEPFKAALKLFPANTNRALWVATHWPKDAQVKAYIAEFVEDQGEFAGLAGKAELARDIWNRMQGHITESGVAVLPSADDYVKLAKLYAEVRGFIEKPAATTNVFTGVSQKVIEAPVHSSDEAWEQAAEQQQRDLLNVSRTKH